jgi:two-component system, sensor histidine kinase and response regulator
VSSNTPDHVILDRQLLLLQVDHDLDFLRRVVAVFLNECASVMAAIAEALTREDLAAVATLAHTLKGSTGGIGGRRAHQVAHRLERAALKVDQPAALAAWSELQKNIADLRCSLAELE